MKKIIVGVGITAVVLIFFAVFWTRPRPNVLLVSVDTLRPDHLGCYGYEHVQTPNIDMLASEGALFTDVSSSVPLTLPSHATLVTGLYPPTHGIRDNGFMALGPEYVTLAEILRAEGYSTGGVIGAFVLDSRFGLDQGFDHYDDDLSEGRQPRRFAYTEINADVVTRKAVAWLRQAREPFFAFVHYYDPHTTYEPPQPYASMYRASPYDGEIAYTDQAIGRLFDFLKEQGLYDNMLIVFLSDHGEGLGEHGEPAHGVLVYESTLKVPLIVRAPRDSHLRDIFPPGSIIDRVVSLVDICPTLIGMLGVDAGHEFDGENFLASMQGSTDGSSIHYFESIYPYFAYRWSPLRGVRAGRWKYILAPEEELYDLTADPGETRNLVRREGQRAHDLKNHLARIVAAKEREQTPDRSRLDHDEVRKLQALGYISGTQSTVPTELEVEGTDPKRILPAFAVKMGAGEDAFAAGDIEGAIDHFSQLVEMDPDNPQAHAFRARGYIELGRPEQARQDYLRIIEIDSTNSTPYFHLGNLAQEEGDLETALGYYEKALDLVPGSPEALANIGSVLLEKGLLDSGIAVLREALRGDPRNEIALVNLGLVHYRQGEYEDAVEVFGRTLTVNPQNIKALVNTAAIFIAKGEIDSTIVYLEKANRFAPENITILSNLGNAYRQKGLIAEAKRCYLKATSLDPDDVLSLYGLAAVKAGEGNTQEAAAILERILTIKPDFTPARQTLENLSSGS
jgi:arylsulfatase A-like enzyme/Tfp pilus assembly protein PilF